MNENVYMDEKIFTTSAVRKANGKHLTVLRTTPIKPFPFSFKKWHSKEKILLKTLSQREKMDKNSNCCAELIYVVVAL